MFCLATGQPMTALVRSLGLPVCLGLLALALAVSATPSIAQDERGSAREAQAMVARAIALYDELGMAKSLRRITLGPEPEFRDRDLYLFVIDLTGTNAASAMNPRAVGTNAFWARDADGKLFVQEMIARASPQGVWVDYRIPDPLTGAVAPKSSWIVLHDNLLFGCGIYLGEIGI